MNACTLFFTGLFTLQAAFQTIQITPDVSMMDKARLAPRHEDLMAATDTARLKRWLERIFPYTCTGPQCRPMIKEEVWVGEAGALNRVCQARVLYSVGGGMRSTFDILLLFQGPRPEDRGKAFRSSIIFSGPPKAPVFLPTLDKSEWIPRLAYLEASAQVELDEVILRSRPMIQGMTLESFLQADPHELAIQFGPAGNPVSITGKRVGSGEQMTCDFVEGS